MNNVLFWVGVKSNEPALVSKYGDYKWMDISKQAWRHWCKRHNIQMVCYERCSISDLVSHKPTWQRWFDVFNYPECQQADRILMTDASIMPRWDAPNYFEVWPQDGFVTMPANHNLRWVCDAIEGYRGWMECGLTVDQYFDTGFVFFGPKMRDVFDNLELWYHNNYDMLMQLQTKVKKGTDQTPLNFFLRKAGIDIILVDENMKHMANQPLRYDLLGDDFDGRDVLMVKYFDLWKFSGFTDRGNMRNMMMGKVWERYGKKYNLQ